MFGERFFVKNIDWRLFKYASNLIWINDKLRAVGKFISHILQFFLKNQTTGCNVTLLVDIAGFESATPTM